MLGLVISVPNIADVLNYYDHIAVFRSSARLEPYTEISTVGYGTNQRIQLVQGVTSYTFLDPSGKTTDWYRTAFISSFTGIQGELTEPIMAIDIDPTTGQPNYQFANGGKPTFSGGFGFDGTSDIPATGGQRTNRNPDGYGTKGYWDGVGGPTNSGIELLCTRPLTPRGECVVGSTLLETPEGAKQISSIEVGEFVRVWDPKTKHFEFTKVLEKHLNLTRDGKIYKTVTKRGRILETTGAHPYLTDTGEVRASELKVGTKLLIDSLATQKTLPTEDSSKILFSTEQFIELVKKKYSTWHPDEKQNKWIAKHLVKLGQLGFLPLINNEKAQFIARILAYIMGDGSLTSRKESICNFARFAGKQNELEELRQDLIDHGLIPTEIQSHYSEGDHLDSESNKRNIAGTSLWIDLRNGSFGLLLELLGAPVGDKVKQVTKIPEWIMSSQILRREFLSTLYDNEGQICYKTNKTGQGKRLGKVTTEIRLSFNKDITLDSEAQIYTQQIIECFKDANIEMRVFVSTRTGAIRKDGIHTQTYSLINETSNSEAWIRFAEYFKTPYNTEKREGLRTLSEYRRELSSVLSSQCQKKEKALAFVKSGNSYGEIAKQLGITRSVVENWNAKNREAEVHLPHNVLSYEQWLENNPGVELYDEVVSNEVREDDCEVYDLTLEGSPWYSTNGIVSKDCYKNKTVAMTRVKLKDTDSSCWAFSEDEVDMFLESALADFNAEPTFTNFNWNDLEDRWLHILSLGATVFALYAQGLIEVGREFTITDNGISFNPPQISGYIQSTASALLQHYDTTKQRVKQNMKPRPQGVGLFLPLAIHPSFLRLRHLRERRLF